MKAGVGQVMKLRLASLSLDQQAKLAVIGSNLRADRESRLRLPEHVIFMQASLSLR